MAARTRTPTVRKQYYSVREVAVILDVTVYKVRSMIRLRTLQATLVRGEYRIAIKELRRQFPDH